MIVIINGLLFGTHSAIALAFTNLLITFQQMIVSIISGNNLQNDLYYYSSTTKTFTHTNSKMTRKSIEAPSSSLHTSTAQCRPKSSKKAVLPHLCSSAATSSCSPSQPTISSRKQLGSHCWFEIPTQMQSIKK